jgi:hypothetical protein
MKNKLLIYLKAQNKRELRDSGRVRACINLQKTTKRLAIRGAQLVSIVILRICFYISPGKYSHSIAMNLMRIKHRSVERSCREIM